MAGTGMPLERLEAEIVSWAGHMAAGMARWLGWVAEFDRRRGWEKAGCPSMTNWLSWHCGESPHTAREKLRVALALEGLPVIGATFAAGELSYCKVRAITRVACADDDADWAEIARHTTGAVLERMVAAVRKRLDDEGAIAKGAFESRRVERSSLDGGRSRIIIEGPTDVIDTMWAAIDVTTSKTVDEATAVADAPRREVIAQRGGIAAMRFDGLEQIAEVSLAAAGPIASARGDVGRLALMIDDEFVASVANGDASPDGESTLGGRRLAPELALRWSCDIRASVMVDRHGHTCDEGHTTKIVNRRLRRALHRRDGGMCRFPGCGATTWLHAHHVVHWAEGGPTDLANLLSLCSFHHHLVHEGGWNVEIVDDAIVWTDTDGTPATIEPLAGEADQVLARQAPLDITPETIKSRWDGRSPDLGFAVSVIVEHSLRARERMTERRAAENVPAGTSP